VTRSDDALRFPLAGLLADPPGTTRRYVVGPVELEAGEDLPLAAPVAGQLRLQRTNRGALVRAALETALAASCSRCLRPIEVPLELAIDEEVLPSIDLASGLPLDPADEPDVARLDGHHELDLEPLIVEAILFAAPIAPLCGPDCPGLCPVCGADLSEPGHRPHDEELDPRLEALRRFRVDAEAETD
jgi:uncharacterized protein